MTPERKEINVVAKRHTELDSGVVEQFLTGSGWTQQGPDTFKDPESGKPYQMDMAATIEMGRFVIWKEAGGMKDA